MADQALPMFCDQCEQTDHGTGCVEKGICGKSPDVESLQKILLYGVKGMAAYKNHARRLGKTDPEVDSFIEEALFATMTNVNFDVEALLEMVLECGRMNLRTMQLLNDAHVEVLGQPEPTTVAEGIQAGPGIVVTGHDLADLKNLLEQTAGKGINVYTHGEMLPGHMYSGLKKHPELVGHYGGAWQKQRKEFEAFAGPIVATTNCVLIPHKSNTYTDRLFTLRQTAVPGARRLETDDFSPVIERALAIGSLEPTTIKQSTTGYHYTAILGLADKVVEAVKAGEIKHFFVVGGCDGAEIGRNYFTEFARCAPTESIILTLGCGKYRIRDHDYGTVAGLPRLLDLGSVTMPTVPFRSPLRWRKPLIVASMTCRSPWSSPGSSRRLSPSCSPCFTWVSRIRLGPKLPAFVTPNVFAILQKQFDLQPIGVDGAADVQAAMAAA